MTAVLGTNLRAVVVATRLLESDMEFHTVLEQGSGLTMHGHGRGVDADAHGQVEIWWGLEIDARNWGVKDIVPTVHKLVMDGWFTVPHEDGGDEETGETFHYEYPTDDIDPATKAIGRDVDAPTPANVLRMARPNWKVTWEFDRYRGEGSNVRTTIAPEAEVDFTANTIKVTF